MPGFMPAMTQESRRVYVITPARYNAVQDLT
jgi:hypothetical protein